MTADDILDIEFVTEPDVAGMGRIIVNDRYYGLPVEAVREFKRVMEEADWHHWNCMRKRRA